MSVRLLNTFFDDNIDFEAIMETLNKTYKGKDDITLSENDNDLEPAVKVGSVFDNNGAVFIVEADDINPSGYGSITADTQFFIVFDSDLLTFFYTETVPVWDDSKQGWYEDGENYRYFFSLYKDAGETLYQNKKRLTPNVNPVFTNDVTINNNLIVGNLVTTLNQIMTGQMKWKRYHKGVSVSGISIYNILTDWVPNEDDYLVCTGQVHRTGGAQIGGTIVSLLTSASGATISIFYITTNLTLSSFVVNSSLVQTFQQIEIMSNFDKINIPGA